MPTDVILGCEATVTLWAVGTVETFEPLMLDRADAFPTWRLAFKIPETVSELRVPTDVMLGCEATVTLWAVGTVETFAPFTLDKPEAFPVRRSACRTPDTVNIVNCPTDVMLG